MKKKHVVFLILFLAFALMTMFTNCTEQDPIFSEDPVLTIHKSAMPYYTLMDKITIDSVMSTRVRNNFAEMVYYKDGRIKSYYNNLNVANIYLRKEYSNYLDNYRGAINLLNYHYKKQEVNFILFNGYLYSKKLPMLSKMDYIKEIKNKGSTNNLSPPKKDYLSNIIALLYGIPLMGLFIITTRKAFINKQHNNLT